MKCIYMYARANARVCVCVFANDPEDGCSIPGRVIPKTRKILLDASSLNTVLLGTDQE